MMSAYCKGSAEYESCSKKIDMIAYFKKDGKISPIKLRIEEEEKCQVIKIGKIISTDLEKLCVNRMWVFTCSTQNMVLNIIKQYKIMILFLQYRLCGTIGWK